MIAPALVLVLLACDCIAASTEVTKSSEAGALPVLVFQTDGKAVQDRTRMPASLTVLLPEASVARFSIDEACSGLAELSARGNSSFYYPKKSYRLELQDGKGKDRKASLVGLPADSDWVLYASVTDKTFTRNVLAHELWRSTGRYAVRWRFVEVFVLTNIPVSERLSAPVLATIVPGFIETLSWTNWSGAMITFSNSNNRIASQLADSYMGLYVLMEKIKRGKDRVNIARLRPEHSKEPEISGGYIIKRDDEGRGDRGLLTGQEYKLRFEDPGEAELSAEQRRWLAAYLEQFERILYGRDFRSMESGYRQYVDVDSFVDFHWLVEVTRNADGFYLSQYMNKDRGGKLGMGPVWDWDATFGNPYFRTEYSVAGWRAEGAQDPDYTWYRRMFEDPDFLQRYIDRWTELRGLAFSTSNLLSMTERIVSQVRNAAIRNEAVWVSRLPPNSLWHSSAYGIDAQMTRLTNWISQRLSWIDSQEYPKPVLQRLVSPRGTVVSMGFLDGRLFYTTNGTDPRAPGGAVSPAALEYSKPVEITSPMTIKARARSKFGLWSAPATLKESEAPINDTQDATR